MMDLESYFSEYRNNIIGINKHFRSPYGDKKIIYADWVASGRLYKPIENSLLEDFGPYVGNTHTETSITGTTMTNAYHKSHEIIKNHVNAGPDDVIITAGFGMTTVVNKFQRILGLRICEQFRDRIHLDTNEKPVVFLTHMEHHSNQTSWLETLADVVVIEPDDMGLVDPEKLIPLLEKYKNRIVKIGSFTAASNVTGISPDYRRLAKIMHDFGGLCFIDFAAAAPYVNIDMHPENSEEKLDAIYFSPHKFLGGPGGSGVLVFDKKLYKRTVPDHPGGGTVDWTNPWGEYKFVSSIEAREDGGTPGFLQSIKAALAIRLKEEMGVSNILKREEELLEIALPALRSISKIHILANEMDSRLGILSFYVEDIHYNLIVKLLNDKFGIQVRGGCSCAGTYGHYLLHVDPTRSKTITDKINKGDLSEKPGWIRLSLHPTMTNEELKYILNAIEEVSEIASVWEQDYTYSSKTNEYYHKSGYDSNVEIDELFTSFQKEIGEKLTI
ncbi:MAG: aminotransferase class V-fold PLP-dependent enzyme [Melioribacteraceae bacterium]|nr:aminotransferase class V-fold PLP-dependent enzyme [Melioribacteraceae bacterium]MCF8264627.1 aminotransferase class V-fold PLP-dependent enzyme [Melioribacteraceae bacterium]